MCASRAECSKTLVITRKSELGELILENPPICYLRQCFVYDPTTGLFTWKHRADMPKAWNCKMVGRFAGTVNKKTGQIGLRFHYDGVVYRFLAHRAAWAMTYDVWPDFIIDHRDLNPSNNSIGNLRRADFSLNGANSEKRAGSSKFKGVHIHKGRITAHIRVKYKQYHLGDFVDEMDAAKAYDAAAVAAFGDFAVTNFKCHHVDATLRRRFQIDELA